MNRKFLVWLQASVFLTPARPAEPQQARDLPVEQPTKFELDQLESRKADRLTIPSNVREGRQGGPMSSDNELLRLSIV